MSGNQAIECDLLVVGSGAGGLAAAVTARHHGLDVIVVEKAPVFGGASARSGGMIWIPCNRHSSHDGKADSFDAAMTYLGEDAAGHLDASRAQSFILNGARMVDFFEKHTLVKFYKVNGFPDYHPDLDGSVESGRSIQIETFDGRELGKDLKRLRPPLSYATFLGMMIGRDDAGHFLTVGRSWRAASYVLRLFVRHLKDLALYGRTVRLVNGNALIGRLAKSAFDMSIPIWTSAPAKSLLERNGVVEGAAVETRTGRVEIRAHRGVVLATGGFPHDPTRRSELYPQAEDRAPPWLMLPEDNTGDGLRLGESSGGYIDTRMLSNVALAPVTGISFPDGSPGVFPLFGSRDKPGFIAVTRHGLRFANEGRSYHDFGRSILEACRHDGSSHVFVLCDHRAIRRYGLGMAKPFPAAISSHVRSGYLLRGRTLQDLAKQAGIPAEVLEKTVSDYNNDARKGIDPRFGRGSNAFDRAYGDPEHRPNRNIGLIEQAPFYAVKVEAGVIGTLAGLATDEHARVLRRDGTPILGLYAAGNDLASVLGGSYPGGGATLGPAMTFGFVAARHAAGVNS